MKLLAWLLLLFHVNYLMFIPNVDEMDIYDVRGIAVDDINSVYEFVDQVVFSHFDDTPEDEDDDSEHAAQTTQAGLYCCTKAQVYFVRKSAFTLVLRSVHYPALSEQAKMIHQPDVISPPPDFSTIS
jgi:hypothetical protein